jgi:cobalt-zinc-cadmium efflux system membrane fusion protein
MRSCGFLLLLALISACDAPVGKVAAAPKKVAAPAESGLCEEHHVLEAVCPKCNPALVAVFKAKGDWCDEHDFPESFCPICKPERGGRPATESRDDGAPADGLKVRLKTKETAQLAGLKVVRVADQTGPAHLSVTAKIVYDGTRVAEVNARAAGVVRAVRADVGATVAAGAPLATIESAGVGADQSRLASASSRVRLAEANFARRKKLRDEGIGAEKDLLAAAQELEAARADLSGAQAALGMVGASSEGSSRYALTSPLAGVVTRRDATVGRYVDTELVLFQIVDPSSMWADLDIPETEVGRIVPGAAVTIFVEGLGETAFEGVLGFISPEVDPHTRTVRGRVALTNSEGRLKGNMYARARIAVARAKDTVVVPRQAVQRAKTVHLVFVRLAEDTFEARRVRLGAADGDQIEVSGRLAPGEEVVTEGSFLLKTETLKGSIGAGCCAAAEPR